MHSKESSSVPVVPRRGLTLVEVIVSLGILGTVMLALALFSARFSQATSSSRVRITEAQLASERLEAVKGAKTYASIETLFVKTEGTVTGYPGYKRQTWVTRTGGGASDPIDYKTVTVQVSNAQVSGNVRKTTVIAPY
ncbi:MAG: type IV pilus modification PilV family protein [Gemmatimonadaceae bacterium]